MLTRDNFKLTEYLSVFAQQRDGTGFGSAVDGKNIHAPIIKTSLVSGQQKTGLCAILWAIFMRSPQTTTWNDRQQQQHETTALFEPAN